jgi:hypothetical protein
MKQLCIDELLHFIWHCMHRIVRKIWAGFVDSRDMCRWALPSWDIHRGEVLAHISELYNIESTVGLRACSLLEVMSKGPVQLFWKIVWRCDDINRSSQRSNIWCLVSSLGIFPTIIFPPTINWSYFSRSKINKRISKKLLSLKPKK